MDSTCGQGVGLTTASLLEAVEGSRHNLSDSIFSEVSRVLFDKHLEEASLTDSEDGVTAATHGRISRASAMRVFLVQVLLTDQDQPQRHVGGHMQTLYAHTGAVASPSLQMDDGSIPTSEGLGTPFGAL